MEAIVTETQDEDLNKPATIGTVRMLAVHADAGFAQIHLGLERLNDRIDGVEKNLSQQIAHVEDNLSQKIDHVEQNLTQRIDGVESRLTQKIDGVEEKLTQKIDGVESKLTQKIDGVESKLTQKIDSSVVELKAEMSVNMSTVMDQLALRSSADRFIKVGLAVAVLGVLVQTVFAALK
jgi:uncharacterized phage infection (PIP) family protein YhgE